MSERKMPSLLGTGPFQAPAAAASAAASSSLRSAEPAEDGPEQAEASSLTPFPLRS